MLFIFPFHCPSSSVFTYLRSGSSRSPTSDFSNLPLRWWKLWQSFRVWSTGNFLLMFCIANECVSYCQNAFYRFENEFPMIGNTNWNRVFVELIPAVVEGIPTAPVIDWPSHRQKKENENIVLCTENEVSTRKIERVKFLIFFDQLKDMSGGRERIRKNMSGLTLKNWNLLFPGLTHYLNVIDVPTDDSRWTWFICAAISTYEVVKWIALSQPIYFWIVLW